MPNTNNKIHPKVCPVCKQPFVGYNYQKYCSYLCYRQSYGKKVPCSSNVMQEKTCLWCHTPIKTGYTSQLYCEIDCRYEYHRIEHQIEVKYPFEHEKRDKELERLKVMGQNYGVAD